MILFSDHLTGAAHLCQNNKALPAHAGEIVAQADTKGVQLWIPHRLRDKPGGVALLLINTDRSASQTVSLPAAAERYTLTSRDLLSRSVELNGKPLTLIGDALPALTAARVAAGEITLAPASITFLAVPAAANDSCR